MSHFRSWEAHWVYGKIKSYICKEERKGKTVNGKISKRPWIKDDSLSANHTSHQRTFSTKYFFYSGCGYKLKIGVFKDVVHLLSKRVFVPIVFVWCLLICWGIIYSLGFCFLCFLLDFFKFNRHRAEQESVFSEDCWKPVTVLNLNKWNPIVNIIFFTSGYRNALTVLPSGTKSF